MASGAAPAPQMEQPDPPIDGHSGGASPKTNQLPGVGSGATEQWSQRGPISKAWCAPRTPIYGRRRSALEGQLERTRTYYRNPQKGVALWMIG